MDELMISATVLRNDESGASILIGDDYGRSTAIGWEYGQGILESTRIQKLDLGLVSQNPKLRTDGSDISTFFPHSSIA